MSCTRLLKNKSLRKAYILQENNTMNRLCRLVSFSLDDQKVALYVSVVQRIIRVVDITLLPEAPKTVLGIINMQGQIIPVFNIRRRFHLPGRAVQLSDQLIIADTTKRTVALLVDSVNDVFEMPAEEIVAGEHILPDLEYVQGAVRTEDGIILIHNLEQFLSLQEEKELHKALEAIKPDEC
jgi:purine-binding chemotaxis protein CheW